MFCLHFQLADLPIAEANNRITFASATAMATAATAKTTAATATPKPQQQQQQSHGAHHLNNIPRLNANYTQLNCDRPKIL